LAFLQPHTSLASTKAAASTVTVTPTASHAIPSRSENQLTTHSEDRAKDEEQVPSESGSLVKSGSRLRDPRAAIMHVSQSHLERLRSITATLLPVRYSEKFFTECLEPEKYTVISFVALYDSQPVGWIRCRIEPFPNAANEVYQQIYVQALGILAPFRGLGLAAELLKAVEGSAPSSYPKVRSVYAHVWESNEDALTWYDKQGFTRLMLQQQYYRRLKPSGAWMVRKELE